MKKKKICALLLFSAAGFMIALASSNPAYVGSKACGLCHRTKSQGGQLRLWEESGHARANLVLRGESALRIAEDADRNPSCLSCHAPLAGKDSRFSEEGVTCEVCHGPGSVYQSIRLMNDPVEAAKNGLVVFQDMEAVRSLCLKCHRSAHGNVFDFETAWGKIRHPIPNK
jgi:hypothetical protein